MIQKVQHQSTLSQGWRLGPQEGVVLQFISAHLIARVRERAPLRRRKYRSLMGDRILARPSLGMFGVGGATLERETGFEPATSSLGSWHSTPELLPLQPYR
jgi:hypothetical protein